MKKMTVLLIVDDDADDREMFADAINEVDPRLECLVASNGEEAMSMMNSQSSKIPDLIFLDLNMPRMNGKQCLAAIKKSKDLQHIPVIIYTTTKRREDEKETKQMGAAAFLTKPNSFEGICRAISLALEERWNELEAAKLDNN